jgi:hypothetical protein
MTIELDDNQLSLIQFELLDAIRRYEELRINSFRIDPAAETFWIQKRDSVSDAYRAVGGTIDLANFLSSVH